jgi:hypothetical protein
MNAPLSPVLLVSLALAAAAPPDARNAKALFFDHRYDEARNAWEEVRRASQGSESEAALYWIARCSESLGEDERALAEYATFLARRPSDATLVEEARTHRIDLATRLARGGNTRHLAIAREGLRDPNRNVRYSAAFSLASLGSTEGKPAVAVLKEILGEERDADLVARAQVALLRLDPKALAGPASEDRPAGHAARTVRWLKVRIYEKGSKNPTVSVNLPVALADLVVKNLPEEAQREIKRKGYGDASAWDRLLAAGPTTIVEIVDQDGSSVKVWTE